MGLLEEKEIESFIHLIVGEHDSISFAPLSNILYIIESLLRKHDKGFPFRFKLCPLGLFPEDLDHYLYQMQKKSQIHMHYSSLPQIEKRDDKHFEEARKHLCGKYSDVVDSVLNLFEMNLEDDEYSQLAKVYRAERMIKMGFEKRERLTERYRLERINLERITQISQTAQLELHSFLLK